MPVSWKEGDLYIVRSSKLHVSVNISTVNLILSCRLLMSAKDVWNSVSEWVQVRKTSSMYVTQSSGLIVLLSRKASSISPIYMVAYAGASLVHIARPHISVKTNC